MRLHRKLADMLGYVLISKRHHATFESHLVRLLNHHQITTVLDVGAHRGEFARALRREGYRGAIHSFEPGWVSGGVSCGSRFPGSGERRVRAP